MSHSEFKNLDGFQSNIWGPPAWLFLHCVSLNYNPKREKEYKKFFESLKDVLPCGACRNNYREILKTKYPLTKNVLKSRKNLSLWLFKVHNKVSNDIYKNTEKVRNKPIFTNSNKDFLKFVNMYKNFRASCSSNGCQAPTKGARKQAKIFISPVSKDSKTNSIIIS